MRHLTEIEAASPFEILCEMEPQINPAIILAEELMRKDISEILDFDDLERAEQVLNFSREEISRIERHLTALIKTPAAPSLIIPRGF